MVGEGGFEPPKPKQQIYSLPHLTALELSHIRFSLRLEKNWSWWTDSNPRPADYKSAALPAELHQRLTSEDYITRLVPLCQQEFLPKAGFFRIDPAIIRIYPCTQERGGSFMTLQELSPQYARQAETVARRLRELRQQELAEGDPQAAQTLRQRQQELRPLLREARELAEHTAHYYDRRYIRREKYRI